MRYMWCTNDPYPSGIKRCCQRLGTCISDERPNMKKNRSLEKATHPAKPIQGITLSDEKGNKLQGDSNLSPERIMDGASTATALLNQILAQREALHQFRHWGINE